MQLPKDITQKVVAYITQGDKLLVFSHPQYPEVGIQVPAGTIEDGESPDKAVLREAQEETGLDNLEIKSYLGVQEYDMSGFGRAEIQRRHFFHLGLRGKAPATWRHYEEHPSDGSPEPIEFEFFWTKLPDEVPELIAGQGSLLSNVELCCLTKGGEDMIQEQIPYFVDPAAGPKLAQMPGLETTILTGLHGEQMMMVLNTTLPGHTVPMHTHPHEQIGLVYAGKALLRIGEEERVVNKGDFYCIPAGVPHGDTCLGDEPFVMLDIFYPVREDFIEKLGPASAGG